MRCKIRLLDHLTIDQIAAGEVVENSASVIKELVENSLDAKATQIRIEILAGGSQLILVQDNGVGMSQEELHLAIKRHATSKIQSLHDLDTLATMGFRGEALAAISAVSKMKMSSATDESQGYLLSLEAGQLRDEYATTQVQGTLVEVHSLFYNVPARKKFQKSPSAQTALVLKTVVQLALAHPQLHFQLVSDHKRLIHTSVLTQEKPLTQLKERALELLQEEWLHTALPIEGRHEETVFCDGWISTPAHTRHNRSGQFLFLNQRPIQCPLIAQAVSQAFSTLLGTKQHPSFVLHLQLPPHWFDINVHPQKLQVRLLHERLLFSLIVKWVQQALYPTVPSFEPIPTTLPFSPIALSREPINHPPWQSTHIPHEIPSTTPLPWETPIQELPSAPPKLLAVWEDYLLVDAATISDSPMKEGLCLVDHKRSWQRLLHQTAIPCQELQELLIPLYFSFAPHEFPLIEAEQELFLKAGISLRPFGPTTFIVDALSPQIDSTKLKQFFDISLENGSFTDQGQLTRSLATCRHPLDWHSAQTLLVAFFQLPDWHKPFKGLSCCFFLSKEAIPKL